MKKWQIWTILVISLVTIAAGSVSAYFWLTKEEATPQVQAEVRTKEQNDLEEVKGDLEAAEDLETTEIDDAVREIEAIDLSGV